MVKCTSNLKRKALSVADTTDRAVQPNAIAHAEAETTSLCSNRVESARYTMEARQAKGLQIATSSEITREGNVWIVPSQTSRKAYTVNLFIQTCTCLDFEAHGSKCKHIHAVEFLLQRESGLQIPDAPKTVKPTYRQAWHEYNLAQTNEKARFLELLYQLCRGVGELSRPAKGGRKRLPLGEMIFCTTFKVYSLFSGRRFISDLREAQRRGYISQTPHFNSIFNYLELRELTAWLMLLIEESALPLNTVESHFSTDSSGFANGRFFEWMRNKYSKPEIVDRQDWLKLHIMSGVKTNVVTSVRITERHGADCPQFKPLVEATAKNFVMNEVSADKAYLSAENLRLVVDNNAMPFIPFKSNSQPEHETDKSGLWRRLYNFFMYNQDWFMAHYHKRSNVEATFNMIKAKFGERIKSKTDTGQINELLCKVLCHNLCCLIQSMYELGVDVEFWAENPG